VTTPVSASYWPLFEKRLPLKTAIHLERVYGENRRNFVGQSFWERGYFVSTVGRDEEVIRNYIRNQEEKDKRLEQMNL
jgi:putative transposase